jgi:nucleotide-binding universal stress UspA family protein
VPWTTRVLVVANRTAGSDELARSLGERAELGPCEFKLLVPATPAASDDPHSGKQAAKDQMREAVEKLRAAGLDVEGRVGDPDPIVAVHEVWDPAEFDEVIVSTLPTGASRWLALDLPRRVGRITGAPVTHVVAQDPAAQTEPPTSAPPPHADWTAVLTGRRP